jgi:hypothetical protein
MVKITLEPARNGVVKRIVDDNHGGSSEEWISVDVYEQLEPNKLEYVKKFFFELCEDLCLDLGNEYSKEVISIKQEWGSQYKPTKEEIQEKIKELKEELSLLKKWETS